MTHASCYTHRQSYLTCEEFEAIVEHARGCCEICATPAAETPRGSLVVDHLHGYGWGNLVRGMLCDHCNVMMGRVDRSEEPPSREACRYMRNAWFARHSMATRGFTVDTQRARWTWPTAAVATIRGGRR
jgi:hypothetical protein